MHSLTSKLKFTKLIDDSYIKGAYLMVYGLLQLSKAAKCLLFYGIFLLSRMKIIYLNAIGFLQDNFKDPGTR